MYIKNLYNLKDKLLNNPSKHLTETEKLLYFIKEYTKDKNITIKTKINENNELECLFVQTDYMRECYLNYGHLTHIDATYCVMVDNFLLFHSSCQNENLNGVPVAYCFMRSETKENLEFYYEKLNCNVQKTAQIIMVDKDLSNIGLIIICYYINLYFSCGEIF